MTVATAQGFGVNPEHTVPEPEDIIVRQSTISSMQLCPGRVGHSLDLGFDRTPSEAMFFGSAVHRHIASFLMEPEEGPHLPLLLSTDSAILDSIMAVADADQVDLGEIATEAMVDSMVDEIRSAVQTWYGHVWVPELQQIVPLAVERLAVTPLGTLGDGRAVWLQGTPDYVAADGVHDWKTSGSAWRENSKGLTKGSYLPQAPLYLYLVGRTLDLEARRFTFWVYSRKTGQWTEYPTDWDDHEVDAAVQNAWQVGLQLAAQAFPYTPFDGAFGKYRRGWWCSPTYCGAWDVCPGKRMIADGVDTTTKRETKWG